jgi:L-ascorbate metabolism protein UlaG (beta-lactamase superfamily)
MTPFGGRVQGLRRARVEASPQFRDGRFRNPSGAGPGLQAGTRLTVMQDFLGPRPNRRPPHDLPLAPEAEILARWARAPETGLRATWLGHSTVLLEVDGARLLTDPVWGDRVSPSSRVGPKRFHPAPVAVEALPPLDAVIISHDHYDHLDYPTIRRLLACQSAPFITSLGVGAHLEAWGVPTTRIVELDWWERVPVPGCEVQVTATPAQHFSGRGAFDRDRTLWSGWVVQGSRHSVYFSGDTGPTEDHAETGRRLGPFDLVMLEVGAWHAAWGAIHLGPSGALEALQRLGGGAFLPVHWGTFDLGLHPWDEPVEHLLERVAEDTRLLLPKLGQVLEPGQVEGFEPWWRAVR